VPDTKTDTGSLTAKWGKLNKMKRCFILYKPEYLFLLRGSHPGEFRNDVEADHLFRSARADGVYHGPGLHHKQEWLLIRRQVRGQFEHAGSAKDASMRASTRAVLTRDARLTSSWPPPRKIVLAVGFKNPTRLRFLVGVDHLFRTPLYHWFI